MVIGGCPGHPGVTPAEQLQSGDTQRRAGCFELGHAYSCGTALLASSRGDEDDPGTEGGQSPHGDAGEDGFVVGVGVQEEEATSR